MNRVCIELKFGKDGVKMRRKIGDFIIEVGGYKCVCGIMKGMFALTMSEERIQRNTSILKRASSNRSTEWETSKM